VLIRCLLGVPIERRTADAGSAARRCPSRRWTACCPARLPVAQAVRAAVTAASGRAYGRRLRRSLW